MRCSLDARAFECEYGKLCGWRHALCRRGSEQPDLQAGLETTSRHKEVSDLTDWPPRVAPGYTNTGHTSPATHPSPHAPTTPAHVPLHGPDSRAVPGADTEHANSGLKPACPHHAVPVGQDCH